MGVGDDPAASPPEQDTLYPFYKRPSAPQEQSGRVRKILSQLGFGPRTFHPVESSYNGYALLAHDYKMYLSFKISYMFRRQGAILREHCYIGACSLYLRLHKNGALVPLHGLQS